MMLIFLAYNGRSLEVAVEATTRCVTSPQALESSSTDRHDHLFVPFTVFYITEVNLGVNQALSSHILSFGKLW